MGRCGCSSVGASGAAIADGDCLSVTGAGTAGSPFVLAPVLDPSDANLLECGAGGLFVPDPDDPGGWSSYSPVWVAPNSPPSIGNGSLTGNYRRRGKSLELAILFVAGLTTNFGSGPWGFTLPPGITAAIECALAAMASPTSGWRSGTAIVFPSTSFIAFVMLGDEAASVEVPGGWTVGSNLVINGIVTIN